MWHDPFMKDMWFFFWKKRRVFRNNGNRGHVIMSDFRCCFRVCPNIDKEDFLVVFFFLGKRDLCSVIEAILVTFSAHSSSSVIAWHVRRDVFIRLIHVGHDSIMCDLTHPFVTFSVFCHRVIWVIWRIYMWHDSCTWDMTHRYVTWRIPTWHATNPYSKFWQS